MYSFDSLLAYTSRKAQDNRIKITFNLRIDKLQNARSSPKVRMRSILSISLHLCRTSLISLTSSATTAVETTLAPPNFSDEEFTTDTALGPLQISKIIYKSYSLDP